MNAPVGWILALATALLMVGCSTPDAASPAGTTQSTTDPAPTTSTKKSAFCLDLPTFQVALVMYKARAGKAINGEPLDFKTLRQGAAHVARIGETMQPTAPPEIAEQFRTVLTAVATSASNLKEGSNVRDVVDPLYGTQNQAAFDAVENFDERGCGN